MKVNPSIFEPIIGYEDVKALFLKALRMHGDGLPVHFLMVGEPASAKTSFLLCLSKLKDSYYLLGSRTTKAGLTSLLFEKKPKILLLDESLIEALLCA
jgi:Holliday junction DNA helicase RuvB